MTASTQRREFLRVQVGKEVTPGVIVPATSVLTALTDIRYRPDTVVQSPAKLNGRLSVANGADVLGRAGHLQIGGYLTFEDILYLLEMGYKHITPPAGDAGSPNIAYDWVYAPSLNAADFPQTYSLEAGVTNGESFVLPYGFLESFEFSARIRDYTNFTAILHGQDYIEQAFTGALSERTVSKVLGQQWGIYIDDAMLGTMGGTLVTDCITDFTFRSGPLYMWANCMNRSLLPESPIQQGQRPEIMITFQLSPTSLQLLRDYQAGTKKLIRLKNLGPSIHGSGVAAAPGSALTAALGSAGDLTGAYLYKYTFVYSDGGETVGSAASTLVTAASQRINLSAIIAGPTGVVARRIYRTVAGGSTYFYLASLPNNTATTFVDDIADTSLGVSAPTSGSHYTGPLVTKMVQIDLAANILQMPDIGQAQGEGALTVPVTFSGSEDDTGLWGKLIQYTVRNRLAAIA